MRVLLRSIITPVICDVDDNYEQEHPSGQNNCSSQLGADPVSAGASTTNLRRLVALQLQSELPEPEFVRIDAKGFGQNDQWGEKAEVCRSNASLCIACGKAHEDRKSVV